MSKFLALARRELIEHRIGMVYVPAIIMALVLVVLITPLSQGISFNSPDFVGVNGDTISIDGLLDKLSEAEPEVRKNLVTVLFGSIGVPALMVLPFVIFFIVLGGLYEERRDRSFLFWKSMPVSDTWEVLTRLGAGMILAPLCFLLIVMVAQVVALLVFTVIGAIQGSAVGSLWQVDAIVLNWLHMPLFMLIWALWAVPVFAWVLFSGAYAPRAPFMYAILPPLVIVIFEQLYLKTSYFATWLSKHLVAGPLMEDGLDFMADTMTYPDMSRLFGSFADPDLWFGLAIAALLIYGAVWLRRYNS